MMETAQTMEMSSPEGKLSYRPEEACAAIGVRTTKLYELIKMKKIRVKKDGRCTLIPRQSLVDYLNNLPDR